MTGIDWAALLSSSVPPSGIIIEDVRPQIDGGRYPIKREVGDLLEVTADIFQRARQDRRRRCNTGFRDKTAWPEVEMTYVDNDRWGATFELTENTRYDYTIEAFPDPFASWRDEIAKKTEAGLDVSSELLEGRALIDEAISRAGDADQATSAAGTGSAERSARQADSVATLLGAELATGMRRNRSRDAAATSATLTVIVDRVAARFAAWYEMFPRSAGTVPGQSATFDDVIAQLPRIQQMGFDVLYFTPIHPIGTTIRKGQNNTLVAGPDDPGVPYAIGSERGGHDAIEPGLGTLDDFRRLVDAAAEHGMEIALDVAIQASPDHPWAKEHPEWFTIRPDGTIKYAENPPKKYEDIYPINFQIADWRSALAGAAAGHPLLGRAGREDLPRRQPAHQTDRLLGVADRRGAAATTRR